MLSPKRVVEKAKRGITLKRSDSRFSSCDCTTVVADKDHFTVYTVDDTRFIVPLAFLKSCIFQELLKMSEEEFGLPDDGPIVLACSADFMEYIVSLLSRRIPGDREGALLASIYASRCSASLLSHLRNNQQRLVA